MADHKIDLNCEIIEINLVSKDPMKLFKIWFDDAKALQQNSCPEAMTLSTVRSDGGPSSRTVLLRGLDERGFQMYWDFRSRKSSEIDNDPRGALIFCWAHDEGDGLPKFRQVRVEGILVKLTEEENTNYFNGEPLLAKLRATVCHQSQVVVDNRESMLREINVLWKEVTNGTKNLTKPEYWGGYRLVPNMIEFYQGGRDAINDRIRFRKGSVDNAPGVHNGENEWVYERLEP